MTTVEELVVVRGWIREDEEGGCDEPGDEGDSVVMVMQ